MEKRFRRVQRWLERCIEACKKEKWSSAVADVECARAELEAAREELWQAVADGGRNEGATWLRTAFPLSVRSALLAAAVIMAAAIPLSTGTGPGTPQNVDAGATLEWVTPDERNVLAALRRSLSDMNSARMREEPGAGFAPSGTGDRQVAQAPERPVQEAARPAPREQTGNGPSEQLDVTIDEILSLYEIGQRALRTESFSIDETAR